MSVVQKAVYAAQQVLWDKTGEERKAYAIDLITTACTKYSIDVTAEQIDYLIEAAVQEMKIAKGT